MKRQRVKFPLDLYWENKTFTLNRSISLAAVLKIIPNDQTSQYRDENLAVAVSLFCCLCSKKKSLDYLCGLEIVQIHLVV